MKKIFLSTIPMLVLISSQAQAENLKPYWNLFFEPIKQCVLQEMQSNNQDAPGMKIQDNSDMKAYLRALNYTGYTVYINTENMPDNELCYLKFYLQTKGYYPHYYEPVEMLVVASFNREIDAEQLINKLSKVTKHVSLINLH